MGPKRRRASTTEVTRAKRQKFTLESPHIPEDIEGGVILVTGSNDVGQLGLGEDVPEKSRLALVSMQNHDIVDVCAGGMHTAALTKEGKVFTFGCNDEGALGRVTEGKDGAEFTPELVELPGKVIQISAGDSHTAALLEDGRVFAWGTFRDSHGNMGLTISGNETSPYNMFSKDHVNKIASGENHIVILTSFGEVYTCGNGEQGQLGRTTERSSGRDGRSGMGKLQREKLLTPQRIATKPSLKLRFDNIWTGSCGTYVKVADSNDVYVCGLNNFFQLGLPTNSQQYIPTISKTFSKNKWTMISGGTHHTVALDDQGHTYVIGRHEYGRLGLGKSKTDAEDLVEVPSLKKKKIVNISAASSTSFGVSDKGELFSWGMGSTGQLGTGDDEDCLEPTLVKGKQLETRSVCKASAGGQHTVVLAKGKIKNSNGS